MMPSKLILGRHFHFCCIFNLIHLGIGAGQFLAAGRALPAPSISGADVHDGINEVY